jgi:hypothetical protein
LGSLGRGGNEKAQQNSQTVLLGTILVLPVYIFKSMFLDNLWLWDEE